MNRTVVTCLTLDQIDFVPTVIVGYYQSEKRKTFIHHCEQLQARFPDAVIIGSSSESNLYDDPPHLDTDGSHVCVFSCIDIDRDAFTIEQLDIADDGVIEVDPQRSYRAIILASSYYTGIEDQLKNLQSLLGYNSLYGGIASGREHGQFSVGELYYEGEFLSDTMLVWLIDQERYELRGVTSHYFQPVGFEMEITAAEGKTIYEIENRPALEVVEEIAGALTPENLAAFEHPFFLKDEGALNFDDALLCSLREVNREDNSIDVFREVAVRNTLKIGISIDRASLKQQLDVFRQYRQRNAMAFLFICVGIKENLGKMEPFYLMYLKKSLKIPFVGFHSYGEIGPVNTHRGSALHNQTISLAVLSERGE